MFHTKIVSRSTRACIPPFIRQVVSYTCGKDFFSEINLMYKNRQDDDILIWENRVFSLSMLSRTCLILKVLAQNLIPIKWWDKMNKIIINIFSNYLLKLESKIVLWFIQVLLWICVAINIINIISNGLTFDTLRIHLISE